MADTVDTERLIVAWLLTRPDVIDLVATNVYTVLPKVKPFPVVRATLIDEGARGTWPDSLYLTDSLIQFDAWGGSKHVARRIADTLRAELVRAKGAHTLGDVTGVITGVKFGRYGYLPDDDLDPPKPRYQFDVRIYTHP